MNFRIIKNLAIVQARMSSSRLPGKVIKEICGIPMIIFLLNRLKHSKNIDKIVLATSEDQTDDVLDDIVTKYGYSVFRGDLNNVLNRFYKCSLKYKPKNIVRITGDCPFVDPILVDELINNFETGEWDFLSNCALSNELSVPDGFDLEIFKASLLKNAIKEAKLPSEKEHVTPWFRTKFANLKWSNFAHQPRRNFFRVTVDDKNDLEVIREIANNLYFKNKLFKVDDVVDFLNKNPEIVNKNSHTSRNEGYLKSLNQDSLILKEELLQNNTGQKLWDSAKKLIPGGNMLLSKRPELHLPEKWPPYYSKAKGCVVWDLDGNKLIDMGLMGVGTNILGYGHPKVDEAVMKNIRAGNMSSLNCPEEVYLAERLIELHEWAEMVRFARTGGEANSISIRIARAATGRDKIAICGYHGWHDWYLATNIRDENGLNEHLLPSLKANGVPKALEGSTIPFQYNDLDGLKKIIKHNKLAAVKMEVERSIPPIKGFLEEVRKLCDKNGIVLIFDECTSGFRETFGGLHLKYKINPDIAIFGKALGNGYAITSVIGRKNIMEAAQDTFISSTFWTERIGPTAALEVLKIMQREKSWEIITCQGKKLRKYIQELANNYDLEINFSGLPSLTNFVFKSKSSIEYKTLIAQEMLKQGFLASTNCYLSIVHTDEVINKYINALKKPFLMISECEKGKKIYDYLETPICHKGFERLN